LASSIRFWAALARAFLTDDAEALAEADAAGAGAMVGEVWRNRAERASDTSRRARHLPLLHSSLDRVVKGTSELPKPLRALRGETARKAQRGYNLPRSLLNSGYLPLDDPRPSPERTHTLMQ